MRRHCFIFLCTAVLGWAQGGSNYSIFGVGDLRPAIGALYDGAASAAVAFPSAYGISTVNPALWTFVRSTRLQGGYRFHQNSILSSAGTRAQNNGKVEGLLTLFAIDTGRGWSASMGFYPLSSVNVAVGVPLEVRTDSDSLQGSYRFLGSGGITAMHIGVATAALSPRVGLGMAVRYYFGLFRSERITSLQDQWSAPDTMSVTDWISGVGLLVGAWYRPLPHWLIAASLATPASMSTEQVWRYSFAHTFADTELTRSFRWHLPALVAAGIAYERGRILVAVEGAYADFRRLGYREAQGVEFQPLSRLSASFHRTAQFGGRGSYWQHVGLSAGIAWQQLYYRVRQRTLAEYSLAAGVGFPLGSAALLEVASQVGMRGRREAGLLQEWFGRFTFTLSLGEEWFVPPRRR
jgi:hypothetical protein